MLFLYVVVVCCCCMVLAQMRHVNVVQFVGAATKPPELLILTGLNYTRSPNHSYCYPTVTKAPELLILTAHDNC